MTTDRDAARKQAETMVDDAVDELLTLMRTFVSGQVTGPDFDDRYRSVFADLPFQDEKTFRVLEELAFACDDYVGEPELRDEGDLDEAGLRRAVSSALEQLAG